MDLASTAQLLGNIGDFIGAIAVVGTLLYLSVQLRQTASSIKSSVAVVGTGNPSILPAGTLSAG